MNNELLPPISVFIPCYNSAKYIQHNITETYVYLEKRFQDFELVFVDDNSTDSTLKILKIFCIKNKNARFISNGKGPTKRENLGKAMKEAKFDVVLFQDQDLSVPLEFIPLVISPIVNYEIQISIGNRYDKYKPKRSFLRKILSANLNHMLRKIFNLKINDFFCGFKAFDKETLFNILDKIGVDDNLERGWFWDVELLIYAHRLNLKITEIPVKFEEKQISNLKLFKEFKLLVYIIVYLKKNN